MAIDPHNEPVLLSGLVAEYQQQIHQSGRQIYLDKSHPNTWLADKLAGLLPDVLFIGIERGPFAVVASMIMHRGVTAWQENWKQFPLPCRFLGIDGDNIEKYEAMSVVEKCATRWLAHHKQMKWLMEELGDRLLVISYESLIQNTAVELERLAKAVGLITPIPVLDVKRKSLDKWRSQLTPGQLEGIYAVTGINANGV